MGMIRAIAKQQDGLQLQTGPGAGILEYMDPTQGALTTVGAGTITTALLAGGLIYRTGPTAAFNETLPTAAQMDADPLGQAMSPGDSIGVNYSNQVAFAATIVGAAGMTVQSTKNQIPASGFGEILIKKISNATYNNGYDAFGRPTQAVVTPGVYQAFVL